MFFPSPSAWDMAKYAPNKNMDNMIGLSHTPYEIYKDGISLYSWLF